MKETLLTFLVAYILFFLLYFILVFLKSRKSNDVLNGVQATFLKIRFGFKNKDLKPKKLALLICFIDPLIIALTGAIVTSFKIHFILKVLIGFVLLMAFIFSFYEILGRIISKKISNNKKRKDDKNV